MQSYVQAIGRRIWIPILVPLLAGIVALAYLLTQPQMYRAVATVVVPPFQTTGSLIAAANQSVANFRGAIFSEAVVGQVAGQTGYDSDQIVDELSTAQLGGSNVVEVSFQADDPARARDVVRLASTRGLELLASSRLAIAEIEQAAAQANLETARSQLALFIQETGLVVPVEQFRTQSRTLAELEARLDEERAAGNTAVASDLERAVERRREELRELADNVIRFQTLESEQQRALNAAIGADQGFLAAQAYRDSAERADVVTVMEPQAIPRVPRLLRSAIAVAGIGLVLAVGLVILLEVLRPTVTPVEVSR